MRRLTGLTRLLGLGLLLSCLLALAGSPLLRYFNGELEFFDNATSSWHLARINGMNIEFLSGESWFSTGLTVADLPDSSSSSSSSLGNLPGEYRTFSNLYDGRNQIGDTLGYGNLNFTLQTGSWSPCSANPCCDLLCGCLGGGCPYNEDGGQVATWDLRLGLSGTYRQTDLEVFENLGGDAEDSRTYSSELLVALLRDRWAIIFALRYDLFEGDGLADLGDGYRLGLQIVPVYKLMTEQESGVDVNLITVIGINRRWYDSALMEPNEEVDHLTAGAGFSLGRTTPLGHLNLSYVYQPTWNLNGEKELSGSTRLDTHGLGTVFTVPLAPDLAATAAANWIYNPDLEPEVDRDFVDGTLGLTFRARPLASTGQRGPGVLE